MLLSIKQLVEKLNNTKTYLVLTNVLLVFFLILFNNLGMLPMRTGDFVFFVLLVFAFSLFRPGWAFLFFIGTIALENINLAPENLGIALRPYQMIGGLLFLAVAIRFFSQRLNFKLTKLDWLDYLILFIPLGSLLNLFSSPNPGTGLKLSLILFSFAILYYLTKNYLETTTDIKKILPFFFGSTLIILLYGFWQNIRFSKGLEAFSVMPGRPNSTLTEPDWLGLYLALVIASFYALIYFFAQKSNAQVKTSGRFNLVASYIFLVLAFALLLISVSRSAWLGVFAMTIIFLVAIFTNLKFNFRNWHWKSTIQIKLGILGAFLLGLGAVYFFHLTSFQLFNRAVSTGGMQKITISCLPAGEVGNSDCDVETRQCLVSTGATIQDISELAQYGCRHINLEEIEQEKNKGQVITEIERPDPNVSVRAEIYQKSLTEIKAHPILGIGWANIPKVLGKDSRGASLNSSNIFLETYLGSGLLGFASLIIILGTIFLRAIIAFFRVTNLEQKTFAIFILASWTGIIIFNLFNAGILLGFFWVWLGISSVSSKQDTI